MDITSQTPTNAKVTIVCVTYNQEKYIEQCLDSIVNQKTNFKYQIFVGEDCSTDRTREIVTKYVEKYPDLIIPFFREQNLGSTENFIDLCERINTSYIAFCDGDDFWTDNNRLQKQYDFMEKNPGYGACFCRANILIESDEWELQKYYKKRKKELIWPDCQPHFNPRKRIYSAKDMAKTLPAQAVNVFLRRNVKLAKYPQWLHNLYICDAPIIFLHIGRTNMRFIPENMCTYRRSNSGIFFNSSFNEHMLNTRPQYIQYFSSLEKFYKKWYGGFAVGQFENRIKLEVTNYFEALLKTDQVTQIGEFILENPEIAALVVKAYISFFNDQRRFVDRFDFSAYKLVMRNKVFQATFYPWIKISLFFANIIRKIKDVAKNIKRKVRTVVKNIAGFILFHIASLIPKRENKWVFTSFRQQGYLDNSKYYFEYVANNYPNIEAVWITRDKKVIDELKAKGLNCCKARSIKGFFTVATASVAITDHFRVTDYPAVCGFNSKTKVVQLWHGVGFKSMGNKNEVKNTTVPGVVYSYDIVPTPEDRMNTRIHKKIRRFFVAYKRELFEEYFALVCPGQERIDMIGKMWNIPEEKYIYAGHPRNKPVYDAIKENSNIEKSTYNVIYAPTYRNIAKDEKSLIEQLLDNCGEIQYLMEQIDGIFTLRLHPHTWRDYFPIIKAQIRKYNRVKLSSEKDIYTNLANYDLMITDYSSISLDFVMFGKPVIYFVGDYEKFVETDAGFNLDFFTMTPGPKAYTWDEIFELIKNIKENKTWDRQAEYDEVLKYFFNKDTNSANDSKVITEELLRRLKNK